MYYTKSSKNWIINPDEVLQPHSESTKKYKYEDEKGLYRLMGRGLKDSPIRSKRDVSPKWEKTHLDLVYRHYLRKGTYAVDYWNIDVINQNSKERLGYPTQKPEALLERIIKASSNEGDIVLDPFCGCGTAIAVAQKLNRQFVGIDISSFTIDLILQKRLHGIDVHVSGMPSDFASAKNLARENPYNFESWAITRVPGFRPNTKRGADGGTDGCARLASHPTDNDRRLVLAQVKGGETFQAGALRDFMHVIDRDKAAIGVFITLRRVKSPAAIAEAAGAGKVHTEND